MNYIIYNNQTFNIRKILYYKINYLKEINKSIFDFDFEMVNSAKEIYDFINENGQNENSFIFNSQKFYIENFYYSTNGNQLILKGVIESELL